MSSSAELNRVLSLVRKLTPTERRQVMFAIRAQDGSISAAELPRHTEDWLLPGIESELKRQGLLTGALSQDYLTRWGPNYVKDSQAVRDVLRKKLRKHPNHAELLALGRVCAKALISYVRENQNGHLGPRSVLQTVSETAAALDASFPGYLQTGTLHTILRV